MDKDKIGLIKYLFLLLVEALLPLVWFGMFILALALSESNAIILKLFSICFIIIFCILPIIYFLLPVIITAQAIKNHWSSYLDKFFNELKLPTIIQGIVIAIIIIYEKFHIMINFSYSRFWVEFYYAIILPYCLIYLVILIHNIRRKYSHQFKKISDFVNKYRGMKIYCKTNKPLIIAIILNIAEFAIVFIPLALIFSIINWILKPIILIQTYKHIIKKYPKHYVSYWLKNDIKNKNTKEFIIPILLVLEIIWFTFTYLFYKTGNSIENPMKYALILYITFGGGIFWPYIIFFNTKLILKV